MKLRIANLWSQFFCRWYSVIGIILVAAFLRLYKISDYMTFLGDEGRDVLIVKHILEGKFTFLGPTASVGGFFLGPIYYYFIAPFLWFFRLDPVGPAVMVALLGVATVFLIFLVGKSFFSERVGLYASLLYTISPLVIAYSRSSWNPNPMPFFSLLLLFVLYKGVKEKKNLFLFILTGILLGITMQLHYLATFLALIVVLYIYLIQPKQIKNLAVHYVMIFFGFLIGFAPFLAFEIRHGFPNTVTVVRFIFGSTGETGFSGEKFITIISDVFFRLFGRFVTKFPPPEQISVSQSLSLNLWYWGTLILAILSVGLLLYRLLRSLQNNKEEKYQLLLLSLWVLLGIGLFGFYKKPIYDYYFGFMFPLPFLLVASLLGNISKQYKKWGKAISIAIIGVLVWINLSGIPFRSPPNRQKDQVKLISQFVLDKTEGKPFNFALITIGNSDHGYRYFFEVAGNPPITIENVINDPERKTVTPQLLIVCEDTRCKPLGHPLWEVAGFGRAEIVGEWDTSLVKVYKLTHYKGPQG